MEKADAVDEPGFGDDQGEARVETADLRVGQSLSLMDAMDGLG